jgi:hypothetical protein
VYQWPAVAAYLDYGQPSAVLWHDQLFVSVAGPGIPGQNLPGWGMLYRGPFTPAVRRVRSPAEYSTTALLSASTQAKLEIRGDRVLSCSGESVGYFIFDLQDLPLLEPNAFGERLLELRHGAVGEPELVLLGDRWVNFRAAAYLGQLREASHAYYRYLLFPDHRRPDVPVTTTGRDRGDTPSEETYWANARYDVLLHGPKSVRLFHAYKDRLFVSVEPDCLNGWFWDYEAQNPRKDRPKPPARELRTGRLPAGFTDPFAAYAAGGRYYLVTPNGKAYMAEPTGKAGVAVSEVWNDPARRIVGVVQDPAHDAVYGWGFVTTAQAPERFYVRLGPRPVAVRYERSVPLWTDRSDAYLESYECARAFYAATDKK